MQQFLQQTFLPCLFLLFSINRAVAQELLTDSLTIQAYAEGYVSWLPGNTSLKERPSFIYNYSSQNQPAINLTFFRVRYEKQRFHAVTAFIAGTYVTRNLAQEAGWARNIGEAYIGYRLSPKEQLWLDAGVFPSHIGAESYIGNENIAATRALVSDHTPYYETGLRVSYRPSPKWYLSMLALNGWQRISAPISQLGANWGMQLQYTPASGLTFNNSSFIGNVESANEKKTRIYSNTYALLKLSQRDLIQVGWDIGLQDRLQYKGLHVWNTFLFQYRRTFRQDKWAALLRVEKIADPHNVLYTGSGGAQFIINHLSANVDWNPAKKLLLRLEWNRQFGNQQFFSVNNTPARRLSGLYLIACLDLKHVFRTN